MSSRYSLRRLPTRDPSTQYQTLLCLLKDDLRGVLLVQRKADGKLLVKKTYGICPPNPEKFQNTRMTSSEIEILRTLSHPNVVRFVDGFWQSEPVPGRKGKETWRYDGEVDRDPVNDGYKAVGARGALYTELCELDTLRHVRWQVSQLFPEAFVWHVLKSVIDALAYLHYGYATMEELLALVLDHPNVPPLWDWQPIAHGNLDLFHMYVKQKAAEDEGYPRIVLGSFGRARRWPSRKDTGALIEKDRVKLEDVKGWKTAARNDIQQLMDHVFTFCTGRYAKPTDSDPDPDGRGPIKWPAGYSHPLKQLLTQSMVTLSDGSKACCYDGLVDFAFAFQRYSGFTNPEYEPLPENKLGRLDELEEKKKVGGFSESLVYGSYVITDFSRENARCVPIPQWRIPRYPSVSDYLVKHRLDEEKPPDPGADEALRERMRERLWGEGKKEKREKEKEKGKRKEQTSMLCCQ